MKKKIILLDLDGTAADTQKFHAWAESMVMKQFGIEIDPDSITKRFAGISTKQVFRDLLTEHKFGFDENNIQYCLEQKWHYLNSIQDSEIKCIEGVYQLCEQFHEKGFYLNIASASPLSWIRKCIIATGLDKFFNLEIIASAEECQQGKPSPDVFLLALKRVEEKYNVSRDTNQVFGIDDGRAGIQSALHAGIDRILWLFGEEKGFNDARVGVYQSIKELVTEEFPYLEKENPNEYNDYFGDRFS